MSITRIHLHAGGQILSTGLLSPRIIARTSTSLEVALVATGATLIGGDEVRIELTVGEGMDLLVRDVAATVAYHGRGKSALWHNHLSVGAGASLTWAAEPLVLGDGAAVVRRTDADVAIGGTLLMRDTVVRGRAGETGGSLYCRSTMTYGGGPAHLEELDLSEQTCALPGMLGGGQVLDTVTLVGRRPGTTGVLDTVTTMELACPGALAREVLTSADQSRMPLVFQSWHTEGLQARVPNHR